MNYFQHLKETLDFIEYNNLANVYWLVKPHPSRKSYDEIGIIENLLKNYKNKNIRLCPDNLTSKNTTKICDNVLAQEQRVLNLVVRVNFQFLRPMQYIQN